jgi:hypothetical protein
MNCQLSFIDRHLHSFSLPYKSCVVLILGIRVPGTNGLLTLFSDLSMWVEHWRGREPLRTARQGQSSSITLGVLPAAASGLGLAQSHSLPRSQRDLQATNHPEGSLRSITICCAGCRDTQTAGHTQHHMPLILDGK